jgi:multidrug resistance protein, MATE family
MEIKKENQGPEGQHTPERRDGNLLPPQPAGLGLEPAVTGEEEAIPDPRSLRRRVLDMAWPIISENFLETMLGIVDTLLVARLGAEAIAGVGSALQVMFFVIAALSALAVGSAVLVAQAIGAGNHRRAGELARQSLLWSLLLSVPVAMAGFYLAAPVMVWFGLEPTVATIGTEYLQVTMATVVVLIVRFIGGGVLRGAGDSRTPMLVTTVANIVNVVLTYGLIFGAFGLPELGVVGSAWATFLARTLAMVLLLFVLWKGRKEISIRGTGTWLPDPRVARQVLQIGIPAAVEQVLISAAFMVMTVIVAQLGTLSLAAHRIAMNALSLSFLPGIGFSMAATALVGQCVGARRVDEGSAVAGIATTWAVTWMAITGGVTFALAPQIMRIYTSEPTVVEVGAAGLRVVALAQPFWGVLFVQAGALRGTGNTQFPLRVNAAGIWIAVIVAYILIQTVGGGLTTVWSTFLVTAPVSAALLWWRFRRVVNAQPLPVAAA